MIRGNRASLAVYSDLRSVDEISAILGLPPDDAHERGDLTYAGRTGQDLPPGRLTHQQSCWSIVKTDDEPDEDEGTGFSALRALVDTVMPRAQALVELRSAGDQTIVWWWGDSDSEQGGFVLRADLIRDLALLGCDVVGTAWLAQETGGEAEIA